MAKKKKVLNKNLVGAITLAGVFLSVAGVFVGVQMLSKRDPEVIAKVAREYAQKKEFERALGYFQRAFRQSVDPEGSGKNDVKYLLEAADAAYDFGLVFDSLTLLKRVHAEKPQRTDVLKKLLDQLWNLRRYGIALNKDLFTYSEKLTQLDAQNADGWASLAIAQDALTNEDPNNSRLAEESIGKAKAAAPDAPRVVFADLVLQSRRKRAEWDKVSDPDKLKAQLNEFREAIARACEPVLQKSPAEEFLAEVYSTEMYALERPEEAMAILDRAVAARPDSADLHLARARQFLFRAQASNRGTQSEQRAKYVQEGTTAVQKAIEIEPSLLDAYPVLASLRVTAAEVGPAARPAYEEALKIYKSGFFDTLDLKSARATIDQSRNRRLTLIVDAYRLATSYPTEESDAEGVKARDEWMKLFVEEAEKRFVENPLTSFMRGRYEISRKNWQAAIAAFDKCALVPDEDQRTFLPLFNQLPKENLALLYREIEQPGESLRFTEEAIGQYMRLKLPPAIVLYLNKAELLILLDRSQEALDLLAQVRPGFLTDPRVTDIDRVRADAYRKLGRSTEAEQILNALAETRGGDAEILLDRARVAATAKDYDQAAAILQEGVAKNPNDQRFYLQLMSAFNRGGKKEAAVAFIDEYGSKTSDLRIRRLLSAWRILFTESDPKAREEKLLPLIATIEDPIEKAVEYFNFYQTRDETDSAKRYLDEAEKLKPDDVQILQFQFGTALRDQDWDRAGRYLVRLSEKNADGAGGATYRGALAFARNDLPTAVKEYQEAERRLPAMSVVKTRLAQAYAGVGDMTRAAELLDAATRLNPRDFEAQRALFFLRREQGENEAARVALEAALKLNPRDEELSREKDFLEEEADPTKGINRIYAKLEKDPNQPELQKRLGELFAKLRRLAAQANDTQALADVTHRADTAFQKALELKPADPSIMNAARKFYADIGDIEKGVAVIRTFEAAQTASTDKVLAQVTLADFYEKVGKIDEAAATFEAAKQAIRSQVTDPTQQRAGLVRLAFQQFAFCLRTERFTTAQEIAESIVGMLDAKSPEEQPFLREAKLGIARAQLAMRKSVEAQKVLDEFLGEYRNDVTALMLRSNVWLQRGEIDKAIDDLSVVLGDDPGNIAVRFTRGDLLTRVKRYAAALEDLKQVKTLCEASPDSSAGQQYRMPARSKLVSIYEIQGENTLAEAELRSMLDAFGQSRDQQLQRQGTADRLLRMMRKTDKLDKAEAVCAEFIARFPRMPYWPYQLGLLLSDRGQHSAAADRFQAAMALSEREDLDIYSQAFARRIRALLKIPERRNDARYVWENRAIKDVYPLVQLAAADIPEALGEAAAAAAMRREALIDAIHRGGLPLGRVVGDLAERLDVDAFIKSWDDIASEISDPVEQARLRNIQAQYLINKKQLERALPYVDAGVKLSDAKLIEHADAIVMRAQLLDQLGRTAEAAKAYEAIIERSPEEVAALNNLAYLLATKANQPKAALQYSQRAINIVDNNPPIALLDTHAWILYLNQMYDEAEGRLREALSIDPEYLPALEHLALLLEATDRKIEAKRYFELLRSAAERNKDAEVVKKADEGLQRLK